MLLGRIEHIVSCMGKPERSLWGRKFCCSFVRSRDTLHTSPSTGRNLTIFCCKRPWWPGLRKSSDATDHRRTLQQSQGLMWSQTCHTACHPKPCCHPSALPLHTHRSTLGSSLCPHPCQPRPVCVAAACSSLVLRTSLILSRPFSPPIPMELRTTLHSPALPGRS